MGEVVLQGTLETLALPELLGLLAQSRKTGALWLDAANSSAVLYIVEGRCCAAESSEAGEPLTDGNHFGQTLINDFGRPYQEGFNSVDGFSAWTTTGRWVGYVHAEYQHAPSAPAWTQRRSV